MRGSSYALLSIAAGLLVVSAVLLAVSVSNTPPAAVAQGGGTLAIDTEPSDNSATLIGVRTVCIAVETGQDFPIDVTIENVQDLSAWEAYLGFDDSVVNVVDRDVQMFLTSSPGANAFDLSESVRDDESPFRVGAANIADPPQGVTGSGVLARLTLTAVGSGVSDLTVRSQQTDFTGRQIGPTLTDVNGNSIEDSDDDSFYDAPILDARVAVDQDCPTSEGGGPTALLATGDGGIPWWIFAAGTVGLVAAAGLGGIALITLRRPGASAS